MDRKLEKGKNLYMRKFINILIIIITIILIGIDLVFAIMPNIRLKTIFTIGCFAIPTILITITMIIQIKLEDNKKEKDRIRNFWLKTLFIIYCILLICILFLNNEYRTNRTMQFSFDKLFSEEHLEINNIVPFGTLSSYIDKMINHRINTNIVLVNVVVNLVLFAPMGFFVPMLFKEKIKNTKQFLLLILGITVSIEVLQFFTFSGTFDVDDIILNTIGAVIIYLLMKTKTIKTIVNKVFDLSQ